MSEPDASNVVRCTDYVDPFIATEPMGNCLPGPYLPLSLVRLGPDIMPPQSTNGYNATDPIARFSHTHVSGTGGGGRYGNIGVIPFTGRLQPFSDGYHRADEHAEAGYYAVTLNPTGIRVELTCTPRCGVHRYIFPDQGPNHILIDAGCCVQRGNKKFGSDTGDSTGGYVELISDTEVVGRGDYRGGWGHDFPYTIYFYARFDTPADRAQVGNRPNTPCKEAAAHGPHSYAVFSFDNTEQINLQVGISFVSVAKARASVRHEVDGQTFEKISARAQTTWDQSLSRIEVEGGSDDQKTMFYSMFTRLLCMPTDLGIDDENPNWHSGVRQFTDFYALWDSVRNANSLISLFDPQLETDMLNSLIDIAEHRGWLPDAWVAHHAAQVQGGSSADILICEAALKGIKGIDYQRALEFMRKNAEVNSPNPRLFGRYLKQYNELGYVTSDTINCVSRHLEYAYQDWCIGRLAQQLGQIDLAWSYFNKSERVWNLWRDDLKCFGPKRPDGQWIDPFDPKYCRPDSWNDPNFYEGTSRQWSINVQHDFPQLVARTGGPDAFVQLLDELFDAEHLFPKETMLHAPYLYLYAGRPDKTAQRVRQWLNAHYKPQRKGLRENEDMGCHSAFYMASTMGIYPLMGQDLYWLTTPTFTRTRIQLGDPERILVIEAPDAGPEMPYIAEAELNGQPLDRAWLRHHEIANGATLRFKLGATPTDWAKRNPPPSPMMDLSD